MVTSKDIPTQQMLHWPIIEAFRALQSSSRQKQLVEKVCGMQKLSDGIKLHPRGSGPVTELSYRISWAKNTLKKIGVLVTLEHGLWALTKKGQKITKADLKKEVKEAFWTQQEDGSDDANSDDGNDEVTWKSELIEEVRSMKPEAFEKLAKQVFSQLGFDDLDVTPRTGDKGIDLQGVVRNKENGIMSSRVYFQCKRYKERNTIQRAAIDEFKGALQSKGPTAIGIFITSSRYAKGAEEAARKATNLITLVDGEKLVKMMKKTKVGVKMKVTVDRDFFSEENS